MAITSNNVEIDGGIVPILVTDGAASAPASTASGTGLDGGVAGTPFAFTIQARDVRRAEVQSVLVDGSAVAVTPAEQTVDISGVSADFTLAFRGATTADLQGADDATMQAALEGLPTVGAGNVVVEDDGSGSMVVTFTGVYGALPAMVPGGTDATVTVTTTAAGDAPYVSEVSTFVCDEDTTGTFDVTDRKSVV